jgi:hypothetical protein
MAQFNTSQEAPVTLAITNSQGNPAQVQGAPVWASSDETVVTVSAAADGMSAVVSSVAPGGPARISVQADADLGQGVLTITGVSEDINIVVDPAQQASVMTLTLGAPQAKAPATPAPSPAPAPQPTP